MQPEPGVPQARAIERSARISRTRYDLHLRLPEDRLAPITGHITIAFELTDASRPLVVDFAPAGEAAVTRLRVNAAGVALPAPGHVPIDDRLLRVGSNTIEMTFTAGDGPLNRRDNLLYSIFVPARAHEAFPCFDQPDIKAQWHLTLEAPTAWQVVSNAAVVRVDTHEDSAGRPRRVTQFAGTQPLPSYLFAFAAGAFAVEEHVADGRAVRLFHTADAESVAHNRDTIVDLHRSALRWLEDYTDVPYPFDTFDIVMIPAFQFSGMEHPGAIYYNAASLLLDASATRQQELSRASLIAHETAHLWFGDYVTMRWFDDVWMKEVCANYMAAKIVNPQFPDLDHDLRFLHAHYPGAYDVDRTAGTHPIRQPLANLADAGSLYGAIIYLKSPIVLRQLEERIGGDALRDALRSYLRTHAFGNASWADLVNLLAARGVSGVQAWSRAWIDDAGRPRIRSRVTTEGAVVTRAWLESKGTDNAAQRLHVAVGRGGAVEHETLWFTGTAELTALAERERPDYVLPNGRGLGYGAFELDPESRRWLLVHLRAVPDALTRASAWLTLWDGMLEGHIAGEALLTTALDAVASEDNELNIQRLLTGIERLFWIFTDAWRSADTCAAIERHLFTLIDRHPRPGLKAAFFTTLRTVASTPDTLARLRTMASGDASVAGLSLGGTERAAVVLELAVRGLVDVDAEALALAPCLDSERRGFLAFVSGAVSKVESCRRAFVDGLSDPVNRTPEPWVIEALRWLHHPWDAPRSLEYLRPCLDLLDEVRRTGDIFLPKRWLDATLSGHRSPAAGAVVDGYLATRPGDYPLALRRMVLASADPLFRASGRRPS